MICIDDTKEDLEGSFPTSASATYAHKIARGIIAQKIFDTGTVTVETMNLTEAQEHDMQVNFSFQPYDAVADQILQEVFAAIDLDLEELIYDYWQFYNRHHQHPVKNID